MKKENTTEKKERKCPTKLKEEEEMEGLNSIKMEKLLKENLMDQMKEEENITEDKKTLNLF